MVGFGFKPRAAGWYVLMKPRSYGGRRQVEFVC